MRTIHRLAQVIALCLLVHSGVSCAPVPKQLGPATFEIESIEFLDKNGKSKTLDFSKNKIAQPPAAAAQSEIVLRGTVTPADATVKGKILVGKLEYDFTVKGNTWEVKIPAQTYQRASTYMIRAVDGEVKVNGTVVPVTEKQLSIAND